MRQLERFLVTGLVLGSGLFLLPLVSLPGSHFSWELFAQAYGVDLGVDKASDAVNPVLVGSFVSYTLTVDNYGPEPATGVVVDDSLSPQTGFVSDTCGGAYAPGPHTWAWSIGPLPVAGQVTCDLTVEVLGTGTLVNTAAVSGDQTETTLANNQDSVTDQAVTILEIPTLSPSATLALVVLLAAASLLTLLWRR